MIEIYPQNELADRNSKLIDQKLPSEAKKAIRLAYIYIPNEKMHRLASE